MNKIQSQFICFPFRRKNTMQFYKMWIIITIMKYNNSSNNGLQKIIIIVLIFRIGIGFTEDHESLIIKSDTSNNIEVAY